MCVMAEAWSSGPQTAKSAATLKTGNSEEKSLWREPPGPRPESQQAGVFMSLSHHFIFTPRNSSQHG